VELSALLLVLGVVGLLFLLGGRRPRQQSAWLDGPPSALDPHGPVTQPEPTDTKTERMRRS
jgi:hypothetical protein